MVLSFEFPIEKENKIKKRKKKKEKKKRKEKGETKKINTILSLKFLRSIYSSLTLVSYRSKRLAISFF